MNISRREFLGGAASFGALAGCSALRVPTGAFDGSGARLRFGVLSDLHIDSGHGDFKEFGDATVFVKALRWFDELGADGVVVAGDLANNGMINQLECVGEAWFKVFPDGRSEDDGRRVEQLFIYGNRDLEGQNAQHFGDRYVDRQSFEAAQVRRDPAGAWERVFHERYSPIWRKEVKGYSFVGAHWLASPNAWDGVPAVEPYFRKNETTFEPGKPFFYIQHNHPLDTVYGAEAWRPDKGYATRALSNFPRAIAFSGHSHTSLTDERSVWQGSFTSIATSSLRFGGGVNRWEQRQGMFATVYDDRIVLKRRDFQHDLPLGEDWVIPLDPQERPWMFARRKQSVKPPEFAAEAKLVAKREADCWRLTIPCANAAAARAFCYEIAAEFADGQILNFLTWDAKYNMPRELAGEPTVFLLKDEKLPKDADGKPLAPSFTVTPLDSYENRGNALKLTLNEAV